MGNLWIDRIQIVDDLLTCVLQASDLRQYVVPVVEFPASLVCAFPASSGDGQYLHRRSSSDLGNVVVGFTVRVIGLVVLLVSIPGVVVWVGEVSCGNIVAEYRYRSWIGYEFPDRL